MRAIALPLVSIFMFLGGVAKATALTVAGFNFADGEQAFADDAFFLSELGAQLIRPPLVAPPPLPLGRLCQAVTSRSA